jgi:hypothetical protein
MVGMLGNLENVMRKGIFTPLTAEIWYYEALQPVSGTACNE